MRRCSVLPVLPVSDGTWLSGDHKGDPIFLLTKFRYDTYFCVSRETQPAYIDIGSGVHLYLVPSDSISDYIPVLTCVSRETFYTAIAQHLTIRYTVSVIQFYLIALSVMQHPLRDLLCCSAFFTLLII